MRLLLCTLCVLYAFVSIPSHANTPLTTPMAYVISQDTQQNQRSKQGLATLSTLLSKRSTARLGTPVATNIDNPDLPLYPIVYWPLPDTPQSLITQSLEHLRAYVHRDGLLFIDTRAAQNPYRRQQWQPYLIELLYALNLPVTAPLKKDHVLHRSFYILDTFPGRYAGNTLSAIQPEGQPSYVSPVIIGHNDYAAAWAVNDQGQPMVGLVGGGRRQREMSWRVGVNLVLYALTGTYKTDQVHVDTILKRLGK